MYSFYRGIKEIWLEHSQEYLGFIYSLLHSALTELCQLTSATKLSDICRKAYSAESIIWSNIFVEYKCGERSLKVYLEKMTNGIKPDILETRYTS